MLGPNPALVMCGTVHEASDQTAGALVEMQALQLRTGKKP
jgi:hypothetical protein